MRPYSPFDHPLGTPAPSFPGRWCTIVGDVDHGFERVSLFIWGNVAAFLWYFPWLLSPQFWTSKWVVTGTTCTYVQHITTAGALYAETSGVLVLTAFVGVLLLWGFGRVKG
jgi:hypothetical protein